MRRLLTGERHDDEGDEEGSEQEKKSDEVALLTHAIWSGSEKLLVSVVVRAPAQRAEEEKHDGIGAGEEGEEIHAFPGSYASVTDFRSVLPEVAQSEDEGEHEEWEDEGANEHGLPVAPRRREESGAEDDDGDDEIALPAHAEWPGSGPQVLVILFHPVLPHSLARLRAGRRRSGRAAVAHCNRRTPPCSP